MEATDPTSPESTQPAPNVAPPPLLFRLAAVSMVVLTCAYLANTVREHMSRAARSRATAACLQLERHGESGGGIPYGAISACASAALVDGLDETGRFVREPAP